MNVADECNDALRSPRPPLLRLSWACCQTKSDGSIHMLSEKVWQISSSNNCNPSSATGGVHMALWTIRQKPPHLHSNNRATWESTEPTSFSSVKNLEAFALFSAMVIFFLKLLFDYNTHIQHCIYMKFYIHTMTQGTHKQTNWKQLRGWILLNMAEETH